MNKVIKILLLSSVFMLGGVYGCNSWKRMAQNVMPMMTCAMQSFSTSHENRSFAKFPGIPQSMTFNQSNPIKCDDSGNFKLKCTEVTPDWVTTNVAGTIVHLEFRQEARDVMEQLFPGVFYCLFIENGSKPFEFNGKSFVRKST